MKKLPFLPALLAALAILSFWAPAAKADLSNAQVVATCGSQSLPTGATRALTQDPTGKACVNASVTANASIASFSPTATQTLAVSGTSARSTALSGSTQLIQNTGTTDVYLVFGNSSVVATTSGTLLRAGYAISYDISASGATNVAAITASGTTSLTITGGAGQPSMAGASGGGAAGAVTVASNADVTEGAITDTTCGASHTVSGCLYALTAAMSTATPAGTNTIGNTNVFQNSSGYVIPPAADASALLNMTTATTTQIVALSSGKAIYVSSYDLNANGTTTANFVYGTGTNCATGTTAITSTLNLTAQAGISRGSGLGALFKVPASNALCVVNGSAVNLQADVSFAQF